MDRSAAKAWVDANIKPLMQTLGVPHWHVTVRYDRAGEGRKIDGSSWQTQGRCSRNVDYNQADIVIDPDEIEDLAELEDVLVHELLHVVLAPFDLYSNFMEEFVPEGPGKAQSAGIWNHCVEKAVINLNRMRIGLKSAPKAARRPGTRPGRRKPR